MPVAKDVHATTPLAAHRDRPVTSSAGRPVTAAVNRESDAETHLVRLCLDLQLDAMMLALGAASVSAARGNDVRSTTPPWDRWVAEDVQMVRDLATDVTSGGAALPPLLGSEFDHAVPAAAVDNLVARYESMATLLADVRLTGGEGSTAPHRPCIQEALTRCEQRLRELRSNRLEQTPPRGLDLAGPVERASLPGEWLG